MWRRCSVRADVRVASRCRLHFRAFSSSSSSSSSPAVVFHDGAVAETQQSSKEFLLSQPSGAYTTARTCCGSQRIFEWAMHLQRLHDSATKMVSRDERLSASHRAAVLRAVAETNTADSLRAQVEDSVAQALASHLTADPSPTERRLTVLVTWPERSDASEADGAAAAASPLSVSAFVTALPPVPPPPVRVEVRGAPRTNASAKDSAWMAQKAPLLALMHRSAPAVGKVEEVLLSERVGDGGATEVVEGTETNFFAVTKDGVVQTAPAEKVLSGTVRRVVLEVCEREGIPVDLAAPAISTHAEEQWAGALLSSTSRLLLPVDELYMPQEGEPSQPSDLRMKFSNAGSLAERLARLVQAEVESNSDPAPTKQ